LFLVFVEPPEVLDPPDGLPPFDLDPPNGFVLVLEKPLEATDPLDGFPTFDLDPPNGLFLVFVEAPDDLDPPDVIPPFDLDPPNGLIPVFVEPPGGLDPSDGNLPLVLDAPNGFFIVFELSAVGPLFDVIAFDPADGNPLNVPEPPCIPPFEGILEDPLEEETAEPLAGELNPPNWLPAGLEPLVGTPALEGDPLPEG